MTARRMKIRGDVREDRNILPIPLTKDSRPANAQSAPNPGGPGNGSCLMKNNHPHSQDKPLAPRGGILPVNLGQGNGDRNGNGIPKLTKSGRACDKCRSLRKRCDGGKPCPSCRDLGTPCEYTGSDGRKKEEWKARVQALEQRNRYLEEQVAQLSAQQHQAQRLETVRGPGHYSIDFHPLRDEDDEMVHMFYAATADHPLLCRMVSQYGHHRGNHREKLPDEKLTRYALDAFFQCAATLFYVTTEEQATQLMNKVYHSDEASMEDVCELSALAAIGSHYKIDEVPEEARAAYFFLASTSLNEAMQGDQIQGMRIFICLCMSCIMDKSSNARLLIMSALNIARSRMEPQLQHASPDGRDTEYRRTLQTLVFLEGWLSYSLGYRNCLTEREIDLVHSLWPPAALSSPMTPEAYTTRLIQNQMTKLALLASGIQDEMVLRQADYWAHADRLSLKLDLWHQGLPPQLHLAALNKPEKSVTVLQERAIYMMHMLYIDSRLQLYCQLLKASQSGTNGTGIGADQFQQDPGCSPETLFKQVPKHIYDVHTDFSIQLARIIMLMFSNEAIMTRCWLVIRSAFDSCIVLLLGVCHKYFTGAEITDITDIFTHIESCLKVIRFCGRRDIAASRLDDLLDSVLRQLSHMSMGLSLGLREQAGTSGSGSGPGTGSGTGFDLGRTPRSRTSTGTNTGSGSGSNSGYGNETTPDSGLHASSGSGSGFCYGSRRSLGERMPGGFPGLNMDIAAELDVGYLLDKKASDLLTLVRMMHQILNLMPPGGCYVWV
ncbi:Zn(II)2Cys6 transcription factor [Aspergillus foveolatus]|uniref:Zn(II)2Cys6 transcription factor n=1 Tax=Aspergillus foveolatus TaxID=210207 RepID=UPI003CCE18CA